MYKIWTIVLIIFGAGLLGGWAGYLADASSGLNAAPDERRHALKRYVVLGVVAAFSVPLFLSVLQSALMKDIFTVKPEGGGESIPFVEFLIFAGFCLVAALSSRAFLDTLTKNVIRDVQELKQQTRALDERVDDNTGRVELMEEVVDPGAGSPAAMDVLGQAPDGHSLPDVGATETKALGAMMNMTYRTATGIGKEIGLARTRIGEVLDLLAAKKLVERTTSPTTGGPRWRINGARRAGAQRARQRQLSARLSAPARRAPLRRGSLP